eukprot:TRINITY_DN4279_c1_g2_i1.p1 TRINITY_DN4279_c1_g2~~TRINITY_DN4279_c1_g2_i1.p1  ORF type:complete len:436 (+),score=60.35 TRINITY_DN4279_c1_g2_i1:54-1310(+)
MPQNVPPAYLLVGSLNSYFTQKVVGYLRWKRVDYQMMTPDMQLHREFVKNIAGVTQIPLLIDVKRSGKVVVDSSKIIDYIEEKEGGASVHGEEGVGKIIGHLMEAFSDEWMKLPAMHLRWHPPIHNKFLLADWGNMLYPTTYDTAKRDKTLKAPMKMFSSSRKPLGVSTETMGNSVEAATTALYQALTVHFEKHDFLLGGAPTLADFTMMGPMMGHLYRDPVPGFEMKTKFPLVAQWIERSQGMIPAMRGLTRWSVKGGVLSEVSNIENLPFQKEYECMKTGGVPDSLRMVLNLFFTEHVPMLSENLKCLQKYLEKKGSPTNNGKPLPRVVGNYEFRVAGVGHNRAAFPNELYKLSRSAAYLRTLSGNEREAVTAFLLSFPNGALLLETMQALPLLYIYGENRLCLVPREDYDVQAKL